MTSELSDCKKYSKCGMADSVTQKIEWFPKINNPLKYSIQSRPLSWRVSGFIEVVGIKLLSKYLQTCCPTGLVFEIIDDL